MARQIVTTQPDPNAICPFDTACRRWMMAGVSVYRRFTGHDLPSLITTNVARRRPFFADPAAAQALLFSVQQAREECKTEVYAYVIMPDHLHLILGPNPRASQGEFMQLVKGRFAHRWNRSHGTSGATWQPRFHERALRTEKALLWAISYVHNNPVAAGLVDRAEAYPWSSVRAYVPAGGSG